MKNTNENNSDNQIISIEESLEMQKKIREAILELMQNSVTYTENTEIDNTDKTLRFLENLIKTYYL